MADRGTVAIAGGGFIAQSKRLPGVEVVEISQADRDAKTEAVAARFLAAGDGNDGNDKAMACGWLRLAVAQVARNLCCCSGSWLRVFFLVVVDDAVNVACCGQGM